MGCASSKEMNLHDAAARGDVSAVGALIKRGAALEAKDRYGNTALIDASFNGHTSVVELLFAKGAALEAKENDGNTALMRASPESSPGSWASACAWSSSARASFPPSRDPYPPAAGWPYMAGLYPVVIARTHSLPHPNAAPRLQVASVACPMLLPRVLCHVLRVRSPFVFTRVM